MTELETNNESGLTCPHCGDPAHYFEEGDTIPTCDACGKRYEEPTFCIDSEDRANWVLQRMANVEAEKSRIKAQAAAILKQLETDRQGLEGRFGSELERWFREEVERRGGRRKSVMLLQGTGAFRTVPGGLRVCDAGLAASAANALNPDRFFRREFDPSEYRKYAKEQLETTGEVVPGVETVPARESFSLKFGSKEEVNSDGTE